MKWKDETSYGRGEREEHVEPRSWSLENWPYRLLVHRLHGDTFGWYLTCARLDIHRHRLGSAVLDGARLEAVEHVRCELSVMTRTLAVATAESQRQSERGSS